MDVEGYLEKRRISLEKTAARLAEKVKRTGKPATLGQMNAHDRRIVHIALKNDSLVIERKDQATSAVTIQHECI